MATQDFLPDNDRDLILAKDIGASLRDGSFVSSEGDYLLEQLAGYKRSELKSYELPSQRSEQLWDSISAETHRITAPLPFYQRSSFRAWAAAAVVLIAAFVGFWWFSEPSAEQLIAQADATILVVELDDGSEVTLRPYSSLFRAEDSASERAYVLQGEAFFDVTSYPEHPFSVQAGSGMVTVLGTRFNVSSWGIKTQVYLEKGRVRFSTETNKSVILEPGQSAELASGILSEAEVATEERYTDWITNSIVLDGTAPEEVIAEIEQHFNITITINELADRGALDGTLRLDSVQQTLEDLGLVLGGTFRKIADDTYAFIPLD